MAEHDLALFIGRFRPWHLGHQQTLKTALEWSDRVLILVGSSGGPPTPRDPFTFAQVARMIRESNLSAVADGRLIIEPLFDSKYNNPQWLRDVNGAVDRVLLTVSPGIRPPSVALVGHDKKDGTGDHHKWFPQFANIPLEPALSRDASVIRQQYFMLGEQYVRHCDGLGGQDDKSYDADVPTPVRNFLQEFMLTPTYKSLCAEVDFNYRYKIRLQQGGEFSNQPNTADALVYHETGHVLLVKRKNHPGKGLWAIPGGFVGSTETRFDAAIRELIEETAVDVPEQTLRSLVVAKEDFDDIHRDARARIFTMCYLIKLRPGALPNVEGKSDAAAAQWWNVAQVRRDMMFADHYHIITKMLGRV